MDEMQRQPVADQPFTYPSSAELERLMQHGRSLRAAALADLAKSVTRAVRRAFNRTAGSGPASSGHWRPQAR